MGKKKTKKETTGHQDQTFIVGIGATAGGLKSA
jgi:hypothetical protein